MIELFDDADEYRLQFWAPVVPQGSLTDGFEELRDRFEREHGVTIDIIINSNYTERVGEFRRLAAEDKKSYDEPAFRFLQILEHLR